MRTLPNLPILTRPYSSKECTKAVIVWISRGWSLREDSAFSPVGTTENRLRCSAVPTGLSCLLIVTQDCVLGYFQAVPTGLNAEFSRRL
jgi:hypothetical protein